VPNPSASHLNLWKKRLGRVPDSVWEQTELETLVLADNDLTEVSEQIGRLKKLRMLDLGHNQLTRVPDALADLDGLTDFLYLHDNPGRGPSNSFLRAQTRDARGTRMKPRARRHQRIQLPRDFILVPRASRV